MGLRTKFNLVLVAAFVVGLGLAGLLSFQIVERNARHEVVQNAEIMIEAASAIRQYTSTEISPLLSVQMEEYGTFLPHSVPSFAAQRNFATVRQQFPDYSYREPALNPTNPDDLADPFEAEIINRFRADANLAEQVLDHEEDGERYLVLARPIRVYTESCLRCHSTPAAAPQPMIDIYGTENGFGWELNETVAAQVVRVPMSVPLERAEDVFTVFMMALGSVFIVVLIVINLILQYVVIKPVLRMSDIAGRVSMGESGVPEYVRAGKDEIASLSASFNRMRRSLENAMKLLDE
jgi:HAMP domain-containing protein